MPTSHLEPHPDKCCNNLRPIWACVSTGQGLPRSKGRKHSHYTINATHKHTQTNATHCMHLPWAALYLAEYICSMRTWGRWLQTKYFMFALCSSKNTRLTFREQLSTVITHPLHHFHTTIPQLMGSREAQLKSHQLFPTCHNHYFVVTERNINYSDCLSQTLTLFKGFTCTQASSCHTLFDKYI